MIEFLNHIDTQLFLFLNGINSPFWDQIMLYISKTITWIPLYAIVLFFIFKQEKWQGFITLSILLILILAADQGSVHLFKNVFQRFRPCHQPEIANLVHLVNGKCGGTFGFVSSHAANNFAFALFTSLYFRNRKFSILIFTCAAIISYSRIYLGVHYPLDIIVGAAFGIVIGYLLYILRQSIFKKYIKRDETI